MNRSTLPHEAVPDPNPPESPSPIAGAFRDCPRNHGVRRRAFCDRARELLPHLDHEIEAKATALYGPGHDGQLPVITLEERLEKRAKFRDWFAAGKPVETTISSGVVPDGEVSAQFARCWQEAVKATPGLTPRFALGAEGFRVPLPRGFYRFNRSVLLDQATDDGRDVTLEVDASLLRRGGLYRLQLGADGGRLESLHTAFTRWKIAVRMLRRYRPSVRPEIVRRLRAGVPFEFSRFKGALKVTLKAGRMPTEVREDYQARAALFRQRVNRVRDARTALEAEGRNAAATFAANPAILAAQRSAELEFTIAAFREARDRLWRIAQECYLKNSLPAWPFRTPDEIRGWAKRGLSPRKRIRLDHAIEWFTRAHKDVVEHGWNPLDDPSLTERPKQRIAQRILALDFAT